jgi:outer membrane protein OmpA-like peptidoglycan-associated protein
MGRHLPAVRRGIFLAVALIAGPSAAEPTEIGGWFGPRVYSTDSLLGYIDEAPKHPMLSNAVELGARIARPFFPWFVPELELAIAPTHTSTFTTSVFWMEPRLHARFELRPGQRLQPFVVVGGGSPIALSSARKTFDSGIVGEGYVGGGVRFDTTKGFVMRFDARVDILPGVNHAITSEVDIGFGLEFQLGAKRAPTGELIAAEPKPDRDGDGIPDDVDKCPDQPEDKDGFEDADGCPDIDNDLDHVLDIYDKCPNVPETFNGFEDEDGCPDTVPPDVDALRGTVEGMIYAEGETAVHDSAMPALDKVVKTLAAHPGVKIVIVGHTDDREAKQFAPEPTPDTPPPDLAALSADLARARAEAVRQALLAKGVSAGRMIVEGHGADEPVSDNATNRGRFANRRVEIKLFIPAH